LSSGKAKKRHKVRGRRLLPGPPVPGKLTRLCQDFRRFPATAPPFGPPAELQGPWRKESSQLAGQCRAAPSSQLSWAPPNDPTTPRMIPSHVAAAPRGIRHCAVAHPGVRKQAKPEPSARALMSPAEPRRARRALPNLAESTRAPPDLAENPRAPPSPAEPRPAPPSSAEPRRTPPSSAEPRRTMD
jgi:hypothetical protein